MKEIEITISEDGETVEIDMKGYKGQECSIDFNNILKPLGLKDKKVKLKQEYYIKGKNKSKNKNENENKNV